MLILMTSLAWDPTTLRY
uniref:Ring finger protein 13 n=1 Tax=Homo sapiens TaxID=9606 RepID=F8WEX6_HUMAN